MADQRHLRTLIISFNQQVVAYERPLPPRLIQEIAPGLWRFSSSGLSLSVRRSSFGQGVDGRLSKKES